MRGLILAESQTFFIFGCVRSSSSIRRNRVIEKTDVLISSFQTGVSKLDSYSNRHLSFKSCSFDSWIKAKTKNSDSPSERLQFAAQLVLFAPIRSPTRTTREPPCCEFRATIAMTVISGPCHTPAANFARVALSAAQKRRRQCHLSEHCSASSADDNPLIAAPRTSTDTLRAGR